MLTKLAEEEAQSQNPSLPVVWPEPEIAAFGPRPVEFTSSVRGTLRILRALSAATVALGLPIVFMEAGAVNRLATEGQRVKAQVYARRMDGRDSGTFKLHYMYTISGRVTTGSQEVGQREYEQTPVGAQVLVTALPDRPNRHRYGLVTVDDAQGVQERGSVIVGGIALLFGFLTILVRLNARSERRVLETWDAVSAQVTSLAEGMATESGKTYAIRYRVPSAKGGMRNYEYSVTGAHPPEIEAGQFFTVLRHPEDTTWVRPLHTVSIVQIREPAARGK